MKKTFRSSTIFRNANIYYYQLCISRCRNNWKVETHKVSKAVSVWRGGVGTIWKLIWTAVTVSARLGVGGGGCAAIPASPCSVSISTSRAEHLQPQHNRRSNIRQSPHHLWPVSWYLPCYLVKLSFLKYQIILISISNDDFTTFTVTTINDCIVFIIQL